MPFFVDENGQVIVALIDIEELNAPGFNRDSATIGTLIYEVRLSGDTLETSHYEEGAKTVFRLLRISAPPKGQ